MKKAFVLFNFITLLFLSCIPDNGIELTSLNLKADKETFLAYEIVQLSVLESEGFPIDNLNARFNEEDINFNFNPETNKITFIVPDVEDGDYDFEVFDYQNNIEGKLNLSIRGIDDIQNPDDFVNDNFISKFSNLESEVLNSIDQSSETTELVQLIGFYNEIKSTVTRQLIGVSSEEMQQLAKFLVANDFLNFSTSINTSQGKLDWSSVDRDIVEITAYTSIVVASIGLTANLLLVPEPAVSKTTAVIIVGGGLLALIKLMQLREAILDKAFVPILLKLESTIVQKGNSGSTINFKSGISNELILTAQGRNLIQGDINSSNAKVNEAANALQDANDSHNDLKSTIDNLIAKIGEVVGIKQNKVPPPAALLPVSSNTFDIELNSTFYTINGLPPSINWSINDSGKNRLSITLDNGTDSFFDPIPLNFSLVYDDGYFTLPVALNGQLFSKVFLFELSNFTDREFSSTCGSNPCGPGFPVSFVVNGNTTEVVQPGGKTIVEVPYGTVTWNTTSGLVTGSVTFEFNTPETFTSTFVLQCCDVNSSRKENINLYPSE